MLKYEVLKMSIVSTGFSDYTFYDERKRVTIDSFVSGYMRVSGTPRVADGADTLSDLARSLPEKWDDLDNKICSSQHATIQDSVIANVLACGRLPRHRHSLLLSLKQFIDGPLEDLLKKSQELIAANQRGQHPITMEILSMTLEDILSLLPSASQVLAERAKLLSLCLREKVIATYTYETITGRLEWKAHRKAEEAK